MGSYFWETAECERLGVPWTAAARIDVDRAGSLERCEVCERFRAPRRYHDVGELIGWLRNHAHELRDPDGRIRFEGAGLAPANKKLLDTEEFDRCICCDSQLAATIGIPRRILDAILADLTPRHREMLATDFVLAACRTCRNSELDLYGNLDAIRDLHVRVNGISLARFHGSKNGEMFREIELLIDRHFQRKTG